MWSSAGCAPPSEPSSDDEAREPEHLAGDEPALVAAVGVLDDVAHLAQRELDVVHRDAGLELHGVEQHLCPERDESGSNMGCLRLRCAMPESSPEIARIAIGQRTAGAASVRPTPRAGRVPARRLARGVDMRSPRGLRRIAGMTPWNSPEASTGRARRLSAASRGGGRIAAALLLACAAIAPAAAQVAAPAKAEAPYVPTPTAIVDRMLTLAGVGPSDYVVDLGSATAGSSSPRSTVTTRSAAGATRSIPRWSSSPGTMPPRPASPTASGSSSRTCSPPT